MKKNKDLFFRIILYTILVSTLIKVPSMNSVFYKIEPYITYSLYAVVLAFVILDLKKRYKELVIIVIVIIMMLLDVFNLIDSYIIVRLLGYYSIFALVLLIYVDKNTIAKEKVNQVESVKEDYYHMMLKFLSYFAFLFLVAYYSIGYMYVVEGVGTNTSTFNIFYNFAQLLNAYKAISHVLWENIIYTVTITVLLSLIGYIFIYMKKTKWSLDELNEKLVKYIVITYFAFFVFILSFVSTTKLITSYSGECYEVSILMPIITSCLLIVTVIVTGFQFKKKKTGYLNAVPYQIFLGLFILMYLVYVVAYNNQFDSSVFAWILIVVYISSVASLILLKLRYRTLKIDPTMIFGYLYIGLTYYALFELITKNYIMSCT